MNTVVCDCLGVTVEDIKNAVENGAKTLDDIKETTGAGTICGCCEVELETTLHKFL
ncbi:MAG: (2Fe-2S)-binding protein [Clostridium sp.]|nr:(2Fe-2S)-binding protein [Clostridium sp.]MBQ9000042.1 (2Fe-2S)-binding protein [Clostridium sp.]